MDRYFQWKGSSIQWQWSVPGQCPGLTSTSMYLYLLSSTLPILLVLLVHTYPTGVPTPTSMDVREGPTGQRRYQQWQIVYRGYMEYIGTVQQQVVSREYVRYGTQVLVQGISPGTFHGITATAGTLQTPTYQYTPLPTGTIPSIHPGSTGKYSCYTWYSMNSIPIVYPPRYLYPTVRPPSSIEYLPYGYQWGQGYLQGCRSIVGQYSRQRVQGLTGIQFLETTSSYTVLYYPYLPLYSLVSPILYPRNHILLEYNHRVLVQGSVGVWMHSSRQQVVMLWTHRQIPLLPIHSLVHPLLLGNPLHPKGRYFPWDIGYIGVLGCSRR